MKIIALAMHDANRGIGIDNKLPFHLPSDLKAFKERTTRGTVIMGRNTFNSIGKPLPNRTNIVLTRNITDADRKLMQEYFHKNFTRVFFYENMFDVIDFLNNAESLFPYRNTAYLIGGGELYNKYLDICSEIIISETTETAECDTFFPEINPNIFKLDVIAGPYQEEGDEVSYSVKTFVKI